ncbi:MAG: peptidase MA domain-containing protein [Dehalococcoidales bacterium]|nr:peptidase MA domain-containing protein [Dehalococcoidales bacterium]
MTKKLILLVLAVCSLAALLPGLVRAQPELTIRDSSAQVAFPMAISFGLSAESGVNITDVRLHYRVDRVSFAPVTSEVYIEFQPATEVSLSWSLEMIRIGGLPPGSSVEYWWTVEDAGGATAATEPAVVLFDDNRYDWQSLTEGRVTLYWYQGDESFARELMAAVQQALVRLKDYTGVELERPVKLYIYADSQDLQGSMIYPQEWTGGVAFTRYEIMAIGISHDNLDWGKRAIAHELTHLVIHQVTLNPYINLPTWLDEGLAMHSEGPMEDVFVNYLNGAIAEKSFISVQSLSSPFSAYAGEAALSYAQSYSLVEFLIANYGQDKMFELLSTLRAGATYDGALEKVYGFDMDGLDELWRERVTPYSTARIEPGPVLAGVGY